MQNILRFAIWVCSHSYYTFIANYLNWTSLATAIIELRYERQVSKCMFSVAYSMLHTSTHYMRRDELETQLGCCLRIKAKPVCHMGNSCGAFHSCNSRTYFRQIPANRICVRLLRFSTVKSLSWTFHQCRRSAIRNHVINAQCYI